jgi:xanthine/uracil permease
MVIWKGWGILSLLLAVAGVFAGVALGGGVFGSREVGRYAVVGGLVVAAVANWFVGRSLNQSRRDANASALNRHSLFFIPMEWWSAIMLVCAVLFYLNLGKP